MKLLLIPASYPHPAAEWVGVFNEHSAVALRRIVQHLEVLTPKPYAPRLFAVNPRWKAYIDAPTTQIRNGITVHRPAYLRIPGILQAFWPSTVAFLFSRRLTMLLHRRIGFDAILSFDLVGAGALAWRLGRQLGIPASGWATGSDVRWAPHSSIGRCVRETLRHLDLVFYQSRELMELGAQLLGTSTDGLSDGRHVVQPRGVSAPHTLPSANVRHSVRQRLDVSDDHVMVLYLGRIARQKGIFELLGIFARWKKMHPRIVLVLVGSRPGYDETPEVRVRIESSADLRDRVRLVPGCSPELVWDYLSAADIFAFPSFKEGMPNSPLEAMLAGLPVVAFGIPSVQEIARFGRGLIEVSPYNFQEFEEAILALAHDECLRQEVGKRGQLIARDHFSIHKSMRTVVDRLSNLIRH